MDLASATGLEICILKMPCLRVKIWQRNKLQWQFWHLARGLCVTVLVFTLCVKLKFHKRLVAVLTFIPQTMQDSYPRKKTMQDSFGI